MSFPQTSWAAADALVRADDRLTCHRTVAQLKVPVPPQHRPRDPRQLIGQGNDGDVAVSSRQQATQPGPERCRAFGERRQRGPGAMNEEHSKILVAALADAEQLRPAAGGVLLSVPARAMPRDRDLA